MVGDIKLTVTSGPVPELEKALPVLTPPQRVRLFRTIGIALANDARKAARLKHATAKTPSTGGGGFWARIAGSISYVADVNGATIGASHEAAAHKQTGGTISAPGKGAGATGAKFLTIPVDKLSRGKSVGELKTRFIIFRAGDCLFGYPRGVKTSKEIPPKLLYVLRKSVKQHAEPWFPDGARAAAVTKQVINDLIPL